MMLKIDLHVHTINSGHAFNTLHEFAAEAARKKMSMFAITDHGPSYPGSVPYGYFLLGWRLPKMVSGVRLLFGVEANIIDGSGRLDLPDNLLEGLVPVIAGIHGHAGYKDLGVEGNTQALLNVMKNPHVHMISHPIVSKYPVDIRRVAEAACANRKLLELNNSIFNGMNRLSRDELMYYSQMIGIVRKNGCKVIVNTDAHILSELGDDSAVMRFRKELGFRDDDIINNSPKELMELLGIK
jgi:putative hydrolase